MALKTPQNQTIAYFIDKSFKIAMTMPQKKIRHKDGFYLFYFKDFSLKYMTSNCL